MNKGYTGSALAFKIWLFTGLLLAMGIILFGMLELHIDRIFLFFPVAGIALIGSLPVLIALLLLIPLIKKQPYSFSGKIACLIITEMLFCAGYGIAGGLLGLIVNDVFYSASICFGALMTSSLLATLIFYPHIRFLFGDTDTFSTSYKNNLQMETIPGYVPERSNKTLIKGLVAGGLILLMLIPTVIIKDLIAEREARQKQVVEEVSAKWATAQTISGPFLLVPYTESAVNGEGKQLTVKKHLVLLSKNMHVNGNIVSENRPRSIYKVLLYKTNVNINGNFQPQWPSDIDPASLDLSNSRLCFGISDFKGIEEEIYVDFNKEHLALSPGLPENEISETGLSVPVALNTDMLNAGIDYSMNVKLKGSERLHFMPLSANSSFILSSKWPSPSFDGNTLPNERTIKDSGFIAKWNYNQANLPFGTVIKNGSFLKQDMSFGVSMVQPADQYNKTMRSVKYAILIIGLTFALFFIVELMQDKPFHPVQYVLVGLALVIFYTLLLAISEYLLFDQAYLIAATATVSLITLYAKSHFHSWKTASVFCIVLGTLYSFIFILLRLEDTALLVGSIGLFIVLAIVMYVSRKVDWYGKRLQPANLIH